MRFVCDSMLGRLARWLRILGFDCTYASEGDQSTVLKSGVSEEREILTRNRSLCEAHPERTLWIVSDRVEDQLREVDRRFQLKETAVPFSRCSVCNELLLPKAAEEVKGKVPYYVYRTCKDFAYCPVCRQCYWEGTHHKAMRRKMGELLGWSDD